MKGRHATSLNVSAVFIDINDISNERKAAVNLPDCLPAIQIVKYILHMELIKQLQWTSLIHDHRKKM